MSTRTVPGSGASIIPIFNSIFGVRDVYVINGGEGYSAADPPRLRIENCGTPIRDAVLRAVIEGDEGVITAVEVLDPGEGYDPLRLQIQDSNSDGSARGNIYLKENGSIDFIQMTVPGDNYFDAEAAVIGGGGSGSSSSCSSTCGAMLLLLLLLLSSSFFSSSLPSSASPDPAIREVILPKMRFGHKGVWGRGWRHDRGHAREVSKIIVFLSISC